MIFIAEHSLRISLLVAAALAGVALMRSASAALRHWLLVVAFAGAAAMPLLTLVVPSWRVAMPPRRLAPAPIAAAASLTIMPQDPDASATATDVRRPAVEAGNRTPTFGAVVFALWIGGTAVSAALIVAGLVRLKGLAAGAGRIERGRIVDQASALARDVGVDRPIAILEGRDPALVVTWGAARPKILLPIAARSWPDDRLRVVLRHELAHIRRGDWLAQIVGEVVRAVNWFNPIVWLACARLRLEGEHACDDVVLAAGVDPAEYATHLVDLARTLHLRRPPRLPAPAMARLSTLEGRVSAMLNHRLDRRPITRAAQAATAVVLASLTLSIAALAGQRYSRFSGIVLDQTNAFLPGVTVTLTSADTQARHEVRTDRTGHFEFVGLPDGDYTVSALEAGFARLNEPIRIAGRDLERTIQLQLRSLQETIRVTSGPSPWAPASADKRAEYRQSAQNQRRDIMERCAATGGSGGMGGNIKQPTKVVDVKPRYPERLSAAKIGGTLVLDAVIGTDGTVTGVNVVTGADPELDAAAIEAVRQWEFSTTFLNCTPVDVHMKVNVTFIAQP